jgi:hypothetical protein
VAGADTVFRVLTEFRFDVGSAVAQSDTLAGSVGKVSAAADNALVSLQRLGFGFMANIGLGSGGLAGTLYSALSASDKFYQSQIKIANLFQSASFFKGPQAFENALIASEKAMLNIRDISNKFSLPAGQMLEFSQVVGAALLSKGLDDSKLSKSTDLARQFLKATPILGVDPGLATGQLLSMLLGRTDMSGAFTQRLFADTRTLKGFSGSGGTQKFNALDATKRLNMLTTALGEFANNTKAAEAIAGSLSGQIRRLKDNLVGVFSIFRPLGDVLSAPIRQVLGNINKYLETEGPKLVKNFADILKPLLENPENLLKNILQLKNFQKDLKDSGKAIGFGGLLLGLGHAAQFLGISARFTSPWIAVLGAGISSMAEVLRRAFPFLAPIINFFSTIVTYGAIVALVLAYFGKLGAALVLIKTYLPVIVLGLMAFIKPLLIMWAFFQLISRAQAIAKIADFKAIPAAMLRLQESFIKFRRAIAPVWEIVTNALDGLANFISPLFRFSFLIDGLAYILEIAVDGLALFLAGFQGIAFVIFQIIDNLMARKLNFLAGTGAAFDAGAQNVFDRIYGQIGREPDGSPTTSKMTTNINKVEINNQFKEQMEPDRIAFTLKEQLLKAAINPLQSSGRSLKAGLVGQ